MMKQLLKRDETPLVFILVLLLIIFSLTSGTFLSVQNLFLVLQKCVELGIITLGIAVCLISGHMDLSIGTLCSFSTVMLAVCVSKFGWPVPAAMALTLALVIAGGLLNGISISRFKIAPMIVTLATQSVFAGIGLMITNGGAVSGFPESFVYLGNGKLGGVIPVQVFVLIPVFLALYVLMNHTALGREIYLMGSNSTAARFAGINCARTTVIVYIITALCAFIAGVVMASRLATGRSDLADNYLMQAIGAAIFGGVSMSGGKGTMTGSILGVVVFMLIENGLTHMISANSSYYNKIVMGVFLLGLLSYNNLKGKRRAKSTPLASTVAKN